MEQCIPDPSGPVELLLALFMVGAEVIQDFDGGPADFLVGGLEAEFGPVEMITMGFLGATAAGSGQVTPCCVVVDAAVPQAAEGCESGFRIGGEVGGDYLDEFLLHWELG